MSGAKPSPMWAEYSRQGLSIATTATSFGFLAALKSTQFGVRACTTFRDRARCLTITDLLVLHRSWSNNDGCICWLIYHRSSHIWRQRWDWRSGKRGSQSLFHNSGVSSYGTYPSRPVYHVDVARSRVQLYRGSA